MAECKRIGVGLWLASRPEATSTAHTFTAGVSCHSGMSFVNPVLEGQGEGWGGGQRLTGERSPASLQWGWWLLALESSERSLRRATVRGRESTLRRGSRPGGHPARGWTPRHIHGSLEQPIARSHFGFSLGLGFCFSFFFFLSSLFFYIAALVCGLSFCGWKEEYR